MTRQVQDRDKERKKEKIKEASIVYWINQIGFISIITFVKMIAYFLKIMSDDAENLIIADQAYRIQLLLFNFIFYTAWIISVQKFS